jgi:hypothetical protein
MPASREYQLATDHWMYNEKILKAALLVSQGDVSEEFLDKILYLCKTLYIESAIHFYGHAKEDLTSSISKGESENK